MGWGVADGIGRLADASLTRFRTDTEDKISDGVRDNVALVNSRETP